MIPNANALDASVSVESAAAQDSETYVQKRNKYQQEVIERQKGKTVSVQSFARSLFDNMRVLDQHARQKINRTDGEMFRYYDGEMYGEYDEQTGAWKESTKTRGDIAYSLPLMKAHVDSAQMILLRTHIQYEHKPFQDNSDEQINIARLTEKYVEKKWKSLFTDEHAQNESLYTLLTGKSFRFFDFAINADNPKTKKISYPDLLEKPVPGRSECAACKISLPETAPNCPQCGSDELVRKPASKTVTTELKTKEVPVPEAILSIPNPISIQYDLSAPSIDKSSFVIWRDLLPRKKAEYHHKIKFTQPTKTTTDQNITYDMARFSLQQDGSSGGWKSTESHIGSETDLVSRERGFFAPEHYAEILITVNSPLPNPVKTAAGETITVVKAGSVLGNLFPKGLFLNVINGEMVSIRHTKTNSHWNMVRYGLRPNATAGSGLQHLKPLADIINDSFNFQYAIAQTHANPRILILKKYLKKLPGFNRVFAIDKLPDNKNLSDLIHVVEGSKANSVVDYIIDKMQGLMQFIAGTFSQNSGVPDARMNTATGVAAMQENIANRILPAVQLRKVADIDSRYKLLEYLQEYRPEDELEELRDECGADTVENFLNCNVRRTVLIAAKEGTDVPQSDAVRINNMQTFANLSASVKDTPFAAEFLPAAAESLHLPMSIGYGQEAKRQAQRRLAVLKSRAKIEWKQFENENLQESGADIMRTGAALAHQVILENEFEMSQIYPEALILEVENDVFLETYRDFFFSDAAANTNPVLRCAVAEMMHVHKDRTLRKPILEAQIAEKIKSEATAGIVPTPEEEESAMIDRETLAKQEALAEEALRYKVDENAKDADSERRMLEREHGAAMNILEKQAEPQKEGSEKTNE